MSIVVHEKGNGWTFCFLKFMSFLILSKKHWANFLNILQMNLLVSNMITHVSCLCEDM